MQALHFGAPMMAPPMMMNPVAVHPAMPMAPAMPVHQPPPMMN